MEKAKNAKAPKGNQKSRSVSKIGLVSTPKSTKKQPLKKKQTCRQDKRRGPKPKPKPTAARTADDLNASCAGCGERYLDSTDEWLQCLKCRLWYELTCSGVMGKSKAIQAKFVCDQCR